RVHHGAGGRPASVRHPPEETQVADTDVARDVDLVAGVHGERDHAVDIAGGQAGVVDCRADRLARQLQLAAPGFLGELGLADPGDGCGSGKRAGHAPAPSSRLRTAVPGTWLPRLLAPWNVTSTRPSPSPRDLPVTVPVKVRGSSGKHGTPRRI